MKTKPKTKAAKPRAVPVAERRIFICINLDGEPTIHSVDTDYETITCNLPESFDIIEAVIRVPVAPAPVFTLPVMQIA